MGKKKSLHRSIRIYLSKLKKPPTTTTTSSSRLLSACRYPKTPSFVDTTRRRPAVADTTHAAVAATLSDVDRFLYENFHSLYIHGDAGSTSGSRDPDPFQPSGRFFVSPVTSSSLAATSSGRTSAASSGPSETGPVVPGGGVAVTTFTKDPYEDFRRSMQEMVDARHVDLNGRGVLDWDFMEELLFCYLELNDRSVHKYVLRAFTDLAGSFRRRGRRGTPERVTSLSGGGI